MDKEILETKSLNQAFFCMFMALVTIGEKDSKGHIGGARYHSLSSINNAIKQAAKIMLEKHNAYCFVADEFSICKDTLTVKIELHVTVSSKEDTSIYTKTYRHSYIFQKPDSAKMHPAQLQGAYKTYFSRYIKNSVFCLGDDEIDIDSESFKKSLFAGKDTTPISKESDSLEEL